MPDVFGRFDMAAAAEIDKVVVRTIGDRWGVEFFDQFDFVLFPPLAPELLRSY